MDWTLVKTALSLVGASLALLGALWLLIDAVEIKKHKVIRLVTAILLIIIGVWLSGIRVEAIYYPRFPFSFLHREWNSWENYIIYPGIALSFIVGIVTFGWYLTESNYKNYNQAATELTMFRLSGCMFILLIISAIFEIPLIIILVVTGAGIFLYNWYSSKKEEEKC